MVKGVCEDSFYFFALKKIEFQALFMCKNQKIHHYSVSSERFLV